MSQAHTHTIQQPIHRHIQIHFNPFIHLSNSEIQIQQPRQSQQSFSVHNVQIFQQIKRCAKKNEAERKEGREPPLHHPLPRTTKPAHYHLTITTSRPKTPSSPNHQAPATTEPLTVPPQTSALSSVLLAPASRPTADHCRQPPPSLSSPTRLHRLSHHQESRPPHSSLPTKPSTASRSSIDLPLEALSHSPLLLPLRRKSTPPTATTSDRGFPPIPCQAVDDPSAASSRRSFPLLAKPPSPFSSLPRSPFLG